MNAHRICLACKHFWFDSGDRGYSSMTPGSDMQIECFKHHWEVRVGEDSAQTLFEKNLTARTCPDFEPSDLAIKHGW